MTITKTDQLLAWLELALLALVRDATPRHHGASVPETTIEAVGRTYARVAQDRAETWFERTNDELPSPTEVLAADLKQGRLESAKAR